MRSSKHGGNNGTRQHIRTRQQNQRARGSEVRTSSERLLPSQDSSTRHATQVDLRGHNLSLRMWNLGHSSHRLASELPSSESRAFLKLRRGEETMRLPLTSLILAIGIVLAASQCGCSYIDDPYDCWVYVEKEDVVYPTDNNCSLRCEPSKLSAMRSA